MSKASIGKQHFIAGFAIVAFIIWFLWLFLFSGDLFRLPYANERNRQSMLELSSMIVIGDDYEKVLKSLWSLPHRELTLSTGEPGCSFVSMPSEIFASDWRLYVGFEKDRVDSVVVRSSDGPKPKDAPEDVGTGKQCGF